MIRAAAGMGTCRAAAPARSAHDAVGGEQRCADLLTSAALIRGSFPYGLSKSSNEILYPPNLIDALVAGSDQIGDDL